MSVQPEPAMAPKIDPARLLLRRIWILILTVSLITPLCGCRAFKAESDVQAKLERETDGSEPPADVTREKKVRWDGGGAIIGDTDSLAYTPRTLLDTVAKWNREKRYASIQDLIQTYPDIALQTIQEVEPDESSRQAMQMIAAVLDTLWCEENIWQEFVSELAALPKQGTGSLNPRARFWRYLKNHQPDEATRLQLTRTLNREHGVLIRAEFHRLEAIAAMMSGDQAGSIEKLETAISLLENRCPWLATKYQLLLGEFYRHAKRWDEWHATWETAVLGNARLVESSQSIDPRFWDQAAFLRPSGKSWPTVAINYLKSWMASRDVAESTRSMKLTSADSVVWFAIGFQHLRRGEGQIAVLAFKKAEAVETSRDTINAFQLYQARSMVVAGQPGAASAILFRLVSENEGTSIADRAKAILGAMKLQNGSIAQGVNLIQSAMQSIESWPRDEQMRAQADYALALLVKGNESEGLRRLEAAKSQFQNAGELDQVRQCLWNLARYYEKTEQAEPSRGATAALADFEAKMY